MIDWVTFFCSHVIKFIMLRWHTKHSVCQFKFFNVSTNHRAFSHWSEMIFFFLAFTRSLYHLFFHNLPAYYCFVSTAVATNRGWKFGQLNFLIILKNKIWITWTEIWLNINCFSVQIVLKLSDRYRPLNLNTIYRLPNIWSSLNG